MLLGWLGTFGLGWRSWRCFCWSLSGVSPSLIPLGFLKTWLIHSSVLLSVGSLVHRSVFEFRAYHCYVTAALSSQQITRCALESAAVDLLQVEVWCSDLNSASFVNLRHRLFNLYCYCAWDGCHRFNFAAEVKCDWQGSHCWEYQSRLLLSWLALSSPIAHGGRLWESIVHCQLRQTGWR